MIDPATLAQLLGVGVQLADESIKVIKSVKKFRETYNDVPRTLSVISTYCRIIHAAIVQITT